MSHKEHKETKRGVNSEANESIDESLSSFIIYPSTSFFVSFVSSWLIRS
jgi:hypothetical protein